mmetsp:Transcript_19906/g.42849  ORF Transcript_19906/g.42849 Transcript_19906/m.42849 type:complete len:299 (-) Transcript_19906:354-1250(-)
MRLILLLACASLPRALQVVPHAAGVRCCSRSVFQPAPVSGLALVLRAREPVCSESASSSGSSVKIKIKKPNAKAAGGARPAAAVPAVAETEVDTSVSIKVRTKTPPPAESKGEPVTSPEEPAKEPISPEDEKLLQGTQSANITILLEALKMGANPNMLDNKGRTPLHFMAGVGLAPACVLLIHFGADVEAKDSMGITPVTMAAGYANAQTLKVLIAAGAQIDVETSQGTPWDIVKRLGEYQYKEVWLKRTDKWNKFKKTDDKLEKLKACTLALDDPQAVKDEMVWDDMVREVLTLMTV